MNDLLPAPLLVERSDALLRLTINRPAASNALSPAVIDGLVAALGRAMADDAVRAVILTGTGTRAFSGGADIKNPDNLDPERLRQQRRRCVRGYTGALLAFDKPLVVALNGIASGAGFMLALHADQIVAAEHAALVLPEIDIGLASFLAHTLVAIRLGDALANDLALTGRRLSAAEGLHHGLIAAVVPADRLAEEAAARANTLGAKPRETFRRMKRWILERRRAAVDLAFGASDAWEARDAQAAAARGEAPSVR